MRPLSVDREKNIQSRFSKELLARTEKGISPIIDRMRRLHRRDDAPTRDHRPGGIDSVFAESDEMTFNNKVDSAFQLAEPGDYSGTFDLSAPQLEDGTLGIGSDGVVSWSPDEDCAAGSYAVTVTYNYSGGLQMKALSLTIEAADLPPVYEQWADDEAVADVDGGTYNFVSTATCWAADAEQTPLTYSFADGRTAAPSGAYLDSYGHLCCTFSTADAGTVYDFFVVATDSSGGYDQFRMVIPVIDSTAATPYTTEMGSWYCSVDENSDGEDPGGYLVFPVGTITFPNPPSGQYPAVRFAIDTYPAHGTLTADLTGLYYVPDEGFRGLDTFLCHLEVYNTQNPSQVYPTECNIAPEYIQVGSCVDLAAAQADKYGTTVATDLEQPYWESSRCVPVVDQAVLGVGATLTVTLTLQNPWGDGVPAAGYWTLEFDPAKFRVYDSDGDEILPDRPDLWGPGTKTPELITGRKRRSR